jgi:tetratricopeptide (TPR) repeat protein
MARHAPFRLVTLAALLPPLGLACNREPTPPAVEAPAPAREPDPRVVQAVAELTEAIARDPEKANDRGELPHHRRARAYANAGDHDRAIADFTEAIRLYPKVKPPYVEARLPEAYFGRAEEYRAMRDFDRAIADFTAVIDRTPTSGTDLGQVLAFGGFRADAHYRRGICHDEKGEHDQAMADYKEAVRLAPSLKDNEDLKKRMGK